MAVPKRRTSKAKTRARKSANMKAVVPALTECKQCHEMKLAHRVCKNCGYYDGKPVITVEN